MGQRYTLSTSGDQPAGCAVRTKTGKLPDPDSLLVAAQCEECASIGTAILNLQCVCRGKVALLPWHGALASLPGQTWCCLKELWLNCMTITMTSLLPQPKLPHNQHCLVPQAGTAATENHSLATAALHAFLLASRQAAQTHPADPVRLRKQRRQTGHRNQTLENWETGDSGGTKEHRCAACSSPGRSYRLACIWILEASILISSVLRSMQS